MNFNSWLVGGRICNFLFDKGKCDTLSETKSWHSKRFNPKIKRSSLAHGYWIVPAAVLKYMTASDIIPAL